jgi:three-Cys-motif partner protein
LPRCEVLVEKSGVHSFGGNWTDDKLERIQKYLKAYVRIFHANPRARFFRISYVDAFAGSGTRAPTKVSFEGGFWESDQSEVRSFQDGSAKVALRVEPSFDEYVFVEANKSRCADLYMLQEEFPLKKDRIKIENKNANEFLQSWCQKTDWKTNRAVVFLDPYGMQVDWRTIQSIARTRGIDLWVLVPIGIAVTRLLQRNQSPPPKWADALTRFFGTDKWKEEFYSKSHDQTLFGMEESEVRTADMERVGLFFLKRLAEEFVAVAKPLVLKNSFGTPITSYASRQQTKRDPVRRSRSLTRFSSRIERGHGYELLD